MKKKLFIWACDIRNNTGEGILANHFIKELNKYQNYKLIIKSTNYKNNLYHKYLTPFFGIFYCWQFFFKKYKICYINYLPLWNIFLFILLPPKIIFGPITGGSDSEIKNLNGLLRSYIFPFLYKISLILINLRNNKILFSTELLKKYLTKKTINKSIFNFNLICVKFHKIKRKNIDLVIYYRKHHNKSVDEISKILNSIKYKKYKIIIIGDYLNYKFVENVGFISFKKVNKILSLSKFSIISSENKYSLFTLNCISHNVKILTLRKNINEKLFKKNFMTFDKVLPNFNFNNNNNEKELIKKIKNRFQLYFNSF